MQQWNWIKLNENGTIDVDVSDDPEAPNWLHIGRAKVKHLRDYGLMVEDADDFASKREVEIRNEAGYTDEVKDLWIKVSEGGFGDLSEDGAEMLKAADAAAIQRKYISLMQRFLVSDENPYPAVWVKLLNDPDICTPTFGSFDSGDLPPWAFGQEVAQAVVSHWQSIPLILSGPPAPLAPPALNRAARRSTPRT